MGVPTSEVGYTIATIRRETTKVHKNTWCHWRKKKYFESIELDKEKNQCIRKKTGAQNTVKEIKEYQEKWLQHVQRMDTNRIPKQPLKYQPN